MAAQDSATAEDFSGDLITLVVGKTTSYLHVHENIIRKIPHFDQKLQQVHAELGPDEPHGYPLSMLDADEATVAAMLRWLYGGCPDTIFDSDQDDPRMRHCLLWIFANQIKCPGLQNATMRSIIAFAKADCRGYPVSTMSKLIAKVPEDSKLYMWLVNMQADWFEREQINADDAATFLETIGSWRFAGAVTSLSMAKAWSSTDYYYKVDKYLV